MFAESHMTAVSEDVDEAIITEGLAVGVLDLPVGDAVHGAVANDVDSVVDNTGLSVPMKVRIFHSPHYWLASVIVTLHTGVGAGIQLGVGDIHTRFVMSP